MQLKQIVEAALLAAARPLSLEQLQALFDDVQGSTSVAGGRKPEATDTEASASVTEDSQTESSNTQESQTSTEGKLSTEGDDKGVPDKKLLREVLDELTSDYEGRGIEVREVGSGFRIQVRSEYSSWVSRLFAERPPKYSRALLETLALIAYRQPITRGEIEDIRGVSVSTNIIKTLTERDWVRVVGHRDVPGKPALYATTKEFLDYFNLKSLGELPTLAEIRDLDSINRELELKDPDQYQAEAQVAETAVVNDAEKTEMRQAKDSEPMQQEAVSNSSEELESLIEADPDGETDSGVVHRPHEEKPADSTVKQIDLTPFDSDGETDSMNDYATEPEPQVKQPDETK